MSKTFKNISISREQYRDVRTMITDASVAKIKELTTSRLVVIRYQMQKLLSEVTPSATIMPVVYFQYVPADEQPGKRWAYRKALTDTIKLCQGLLKERGNRVSGFLAEEVQAEAELVQPF